MKATFSEVSVLRLLGTRLGRGVVSAVFIQWTAERSRDFLHEGSLMNTFAAARGHVRLRNKHKVNGASDDDDLLLGSFFCL